MASYQVLYRKYRPKDFSEVVGQDHIVSVLRRQIAHNRVAHAYLFSGPRGIGKTTVARLIAKAVNCTLYDGEGQSVAAWKAYERDQKLGGHEVIPVIGKDKERPCNRCDSCLAFNAGHALNLIEIDAASNRGIDEIRELREAVRFAPVEGRAKVYIIDEVHQLTKDAFNALLKTLEEPPSHAMFILATTELEKVLPTIVSRTQHFDFRRPRETVIRERIAKIAAAEGVRLEADAAEAIAFVAEGAMRDAESMLGKILAVGETSVTRADVEEILGIPKREALRALFGHLGAKRLREALELLNALYFGGYEMEYLAKMLVGFFRDALMAKTAPGAAAAGADAAGKGSLLPESGKALADELGVWSASELARAIVLLVEAIEASRRSPIPQLPLEIAFITICSNEVAKTS
ncbi:MAG: DNA polymerase III, subunit gamma and tau [Candidatus Wildermuthbacteria bacterium RIFCSPHIGHO2_01_FULL_49_22b]|uniref:DNA polymerase III subunit gamma/tau n=1 Tax=Candidatus Wildermuthbacteria bacterium RIFCSPHIGHO2_01_FULL_49_22b TaxID=1802448 RepID=A0A1G2QXF3_9BACT|nr:MAG: DNA polymerase III, subunit gamma and tau [Candidatus Wildermuthbacteria bacterium RIFCSPHIGHO2_01_FULL_49_22b]